MQGPRARQRRPDGQPLDHGRRRIRGAGALFGQFEPLTPPPQQTERLVHGNAVQPVLDEAVAAKAGELAERQDERRLRGVLGVLGTP
jgi:hypothetical protein